MADHAKIELVRYDGEAQPVAVLTAVADGDELEVELAGQALAAAAVADRQACGCYNATMTTMAINLEKRCRGCGQVFRVLGEDGQPLPREQRQWDLVRAPRYRGGYRWRDQCRNCTYRARLAAKAEQRARRRAAAPVYLTEREAAQLLGVSQSTITRAKRRGTLPRELTPAAVEAFGRARRGEG